MNISKLTLAWKFIFGGGVSGVIEYVLGVLKTALGSLNETTKTKIQAVLNLSMKVLSILQVVQCLVPVKWQTAYAKTIEAVNATVQALTDFEITKNELTIIYDRVSAAVAAWKQPDDETCVDCKEIEG